VIGVSKAYVTRVGAGPFPTELHDELARESASAETNSGLSPDVPGAADGSMFRC
jgi:adenylosuccinate synthase